jgi:hypothetical protein
VVVTFPGRSKAESGLWICGGEPGVDRVHRRLCHDEEICMTMALTDEIIIGFTVEQGQLLGKPSQLEILVQ